jgi:hypothetical protein
MNSKIREAGNLWSLTRQLFSQEGMPAGFQRIKIMYF